MLDSESNPYASPSSPGEEVTQPPSETIVASRGQRFVNLLIDQIAVRIVVFGVGIAIGLMLLESGVELGEDLELMLTLLDIGIGVTLYVAYYGVMELAFQRTIGKLLSGTMVVNVDGNKPSVGQIIGRSFARLIPFEAFSFLGSSHPIGWHDSLSGTRVVKFKPSARDRYLQQRR